MQMCVKTKMSLAGEWGPGGSVLNMFQTVKERRKKRCSVVENKDTANTKHADGSCADLRVSALWRAQRHFMWVSSMVFIPLSLPSYLSITHSPWISHYCRYWLALWLLIFHSKYFFDQIYCRMDDTQQLQKEEEEESRTNKSHKHVLQRVLKDNFDNLNLFFFARP